MFNKPELMPPAFVTEAGNTPILGIANSLFYKGNLMFFGSTYKDSFPILTKEGLVRVPAGY